MLHLLPPALGQVQRAWVRQRPARIGAASPHSISSPTSSNPAPQYPVSWPDDVLDNNCPPPSPHPVFHSFSQVRPPFWKTSLPSPPKTQTGLYFLARPGGSPASLIAKVAGPPPSTLCSFLTAAATSLLASFLAQLSTPFSYLPPGQVSGPEGWVGWVEATVPTMLELREDLREDS